MILLLAILAGLLAGGLRAWYKRRVLQIPTLNLAWLVPIAYIPQLLAFQFPATGTRITDAFAAAALVSSQLLLLVFAWYNRHQLSFWVLGLGLALNLAVIVLNGGLMPISPATVDKLVPNAPPGSWETGKRLGIGKDVVLPEESARLAWLSDRFILPEWVPYKVAFSIGDIFIGAGAFWLLWSMAGPAEHNIQSMTLKDKEGRNEHDVDIPSSRGWKRKRN